MTGLWSFACIFSAFAAAWLCIAVFNAVPAGWLCDYGEEPTPALSGGRRLSFLPHGAVMALILSLSFLSLFRQYGNSFYFYFGCIIAVILLMIGIADIKYRIIPDQFTLALLLAVVAESVYDLQSGNRLFHAAPLSPILGAAAGAGLMLAIGLFGRLVYRREALGFGDVKLLGVMGLMAGFPRVFLIFLITIFLAFFYIVFLSIRRKITKNLYLPLGPYLCFALLLFLAFHSQIGGFVGWYLALLNL